MPQFIIKVDPKRDAYIEWSTVVDAPVSIGTRAYYAARDGDERLQRADMAGTTARYFDWLPHAQQAGGWDDYGLIYGQDGSRGMWLPRARFGDLYDLLDTDINAQAPTEWLEPIGDAS